jgi:hypothetical protein
MYHIKVLTKDFAYLVHEEEDSAGVIVFARVQSPFFRPGAVNGQEVMICVRHEVIAHSSTFKVSRRLEREVIEMFVVPFKPLRGVWLLFLFLAALACPRDHQANILHRLILEGLRLLFPLFPEFFLALALL